MATKADIIAKARLKARIHDPRRDFGLDSDWDAGLAEAWRRMWAIHPDAFTTDAGVRPGALPAIPSSGEVPLGGGWDIPLAALCAATMIRNIVGDDADAAAVAALEAEVMSGLSGISGLPPPQPRRRSAR